MQNKWCLSFRFLSDHWVTAALKIAVLWLTGNYNVAPHMVNAYGGIYSYLVTKMDRYNKYQTKQYTHSHTAHTIVVGQYLAGWPPRKIIRACDSSLHCDWHMARYKPCNNNNNNNKSQWTAALICCCGKIWINNVMCGTRTHCNIIRLSHRVKIPKFTTRMWYF